MSEIPGTADTIASLDRVNRLNNVDFPVFGLPTSDTLSILGGVLEMCLLMISMRMELQVFPKIELNENLLIEWT